MLPKSSPSDVRKRRSWSESMTPAAADLWILRKFMVCIVLGLSVWACYVGIGRVCVPAIHQDKGSGFSRRAGIGLLVVFLVLWLMFMWTYAVIILTPPGYARDHVPLTMEPPVPPQSQLSTPIFPLDEVDVEEDGDSPPTFPPDSNTPPTFPPDSNTPPTFPPDSNTPSAFPSDSITPSALPFASNTPPTSPSDGQDQHLPEHATQGDRDSDQTLTTPAGGNTCPFPSPGPPTKGPNIPRPVPPVSTLPRWCQYCKIIKPDRTHHCRHCGTCILQFDHHCVWVGQCVGWRNHGVFISFNFWAGLFCLYNTVLLIVYQCLSSPVDPQKIVLMAISGFLAIFTLFMLFPTHVSLILQGRTTLEGFQTRSQQQAEHAALKAAFETRCPTNDFRKVRKRWDAEYGGVKINDRWAFGRKRDLWRQEMGESWIGWILPIGRPLGDGIHFPANPRFGPHGEWLRMEDWPKVVSLKT